MRKTSSVRDVFPVAAACLAASVAVAAVRSSQAPAVMQRVTQVDNDRVTVWKSIVPPASESTLHRHDRPRLVIGIVGGDLKTVTPSGQATVTHYETGVAYWQAPTPPGEVHRDVNDTNRAIELIVVEIK